MFPLIVGSFYRIKFNVSDFFFTATIATLGYVEQHPITEEDGNLITKFYTKALLSILSYFSEVVLARISIDGLNSE